MRSADPKGLGELAKKAVEETGADNVIIIVSWKNGGVDGLTGGELSCIDKGMGRLFARLYSERMGTDEIHAGLAYNRLRKAFGFDVNGETESGKGKT